jgi:hypothetical protein
MTKFLSMSNNITKNINFSQLLHIFSMFFLALHTKIFSFYTKYLFSTRPVAFFAVM